MILLLAMSGWILAGVMALDAIRTRRVFDRDLLRFAKARHEAETVADRIYDRYAELVQLRAEEALDDSRPTPRRVRLADGWRRDGVTTGRLPR